ncbi:hypothetical protein BJG89_10520 [Staphylococcus nepalensis]|uniref:DUF1381 domain-containing protein n=1 Tax=Staphylococcus TaxID=1279 RepID=UPI000BC35325|nr:MULTISPECIES: DUF1381 domain-containing protein [Staphylococcus]ATH60683.1 hypothetical protein BJD96_10420 [Staphylococcus nepalensis]ATH65730.1 hypothetical protein BJG89_10520 [Staphylococcus nepalensis]AWI44814.1 hypothetical protein BJG88_08715 [Staphylococcus nepalensis]NWN86868.1 DUF1381 domain-containing protein [Staphylococcus sp.]
MQYLIRHITDSTNHTFVEVIKPRENETFTVVEAESKEEAEKMAKKPKGLLSYVPSSFNNDPISKALKGSIYRKDSE